MTTEYPLAQCLGLRGDDTTEKLISGYYKFNPLSPASIHIGSLLADIHIKLFSCSIGWENFLKDFKLKAVSLGGNFIIVNFHTPFS